MWTLGLLVGLAAFSVVVYFAMIKVKPRTPRPVLDRTALDEIEALKPRLMRHVVALASEIGERNVWCPQGLRAAATYIRGAWSAQGVQVAEDAYELDGQRCVNLIAELRGSSRPDEVVLVGAHYDSLIGTSGANDNATGVAVLLEMPAVLKQSGLARTLRLVAFVNEEPPLFRSMQMGSRIYARNARKRGDKIVAMISLDTVGYYSDAPGSQGYPPPFGFFYPNRADFLAVVGNLASRRLVIDFLRHFMAATDFPVEGAATFGWIPGVDWSDHGSFWKEGYPAIMLTDTALYRYPHYHSLDDLPDKVNARAYARAAHGIIGAVRLLAQAQTI